MYVCLCCVSVVCCSLCLSLSLCLLLLAGWRLLPCLPRYLPSPLPATSAYIMTQQDQFVKANPEVNGVVCRSARKRGNAFCVLPLDKDCAAWCNVCVGVMPLSYYV